MYDAFMTSPSEDTVINHIVRSDSRVESIIITFIFIAKDLVNTVHKFFSECYFIGPRAARVSLCNSTVDSRQRNELFPAVMY